MDGTSGAGTAEPPVACASAFEAKVWELVQGEDFQSKMASFRSNAQYQAKRRGGRARTKLVDAAGREAVAIQFQPT